MIVNVICFDVTYELNEIKFLLIGDYINYLWFINSLIYYMVIVYVIESIIKKQYDEFFLFMVFMIVCNIGKLESLNSIYFMSIMYFLAGYVINKFQIGFKKSYLIAPFVLLYPYFVNLEYVTIDVYALIFSSLVFIIVKSINLREIKLDSYFALIMLTIHYYFINLLHLNTNSYIINFIVISIISSIITYVVIKIIRIKHV